MSRRRLALYRVAWSWHFWSGLLITPVFVLTCLTGAIFVFQEEIHDWRGTAPARLEVAPGETIDADAFDRFEAEVASLKPEYALRFVRVEADPAEPWVGVLLPREEDEDRPLLQAIFDPYTKTLDDVRDPKKGFLPTVISLHRGLWAGPVGRMFVELATSWGIVSTLLGLYLWWPRRRSRFWGVFLPRMRGRLALRDWHVVPSFYFAPVGLLVLLTGLLFTQGWGTSYLAINATTGGFPSFLVSPPKSAAPPDVEHPRIAIEEVFSRAQAFFPFTGTAYTLAIPEGETDGAFSVRSDLRNPFDPMGVVFVDALDGSVLLEGREDALPLRARLTLLFYPIHVGSVFGLPTKILAVVTCLVLAASASTGVWLWWRRRPPGRWGAPRTVSRDQHPAWLFWLTVGMGLFLPTVGLTLLGMLAWDRWQVRRARLDGA
ncbi:MAG: PepSY domain-containing protein [Myxococcota bacterium]